MPDGMQHALGRLLVGQEKAKQQRHGQRAESTQDLICVEVLK